jgi:hypothetical protein
MNSTYSFVDTSGSASSPFNGTYIFAGQKGVKQITVAMQMEKAVLDVAADGAVMASFVPGDPGTISVECQQTSDFYKFCLVWYNLAKIAATLGDVADFFGGTMTVRNITDGTSHVASGVAIGKLPDKVYAAQGQNVTVAFVCCDIQSITV